MAPATTSSSAPDTTTTAAPTTTSTVPRLAPPEIENPNDVARRAFRPIDGYTNVFGASERDLALADLFDKWIPDVVAKGFALAIVENESLDHVVVASISPLTGLRGYPWIADLFALFANEDGDEPQSAIDVVEVEAETGGTFFLWGDGDGVIIATADDPAVARTYLELYAETDTPNAVWSRGDCLYLPQDEPDFYGNTPWAPFPMDMVVPCSGPHNAEVIEAEYEALTLPRFDGSQIAFDRAYLCDEAYSREFDGMPQGEYLPSLITYMPDADEWDRGDRYLACVVYIGDVGGSDLLFTGKMKELPDLAWSLDDRSCTEDSGKLEISCSAAHRFQFLGSVIYDGEEYSVDSDDLDLACESLAGGYSEPPDPEIEVVTVGFDLGPFQFEQGYRTVNCYAVAADEFSFVDVTGSFFGDWRVVDEEAVSS